MVKKLDIIIPVYKAHKTLTKALASIAMQEGVENFTITIVNDCCPDGSYEKIIRPFKKIMAIQEIKLFKNSGPGVARQIGIEQTHNPYIMFVDADDALGQPFAISNLFQCLEESRTGRICTGAFIEKNMLKTPDGRLINYDVPYNNDMIWCFSKIYERKFLEENSIKFPPTRGNEDLVFNLMCITINQLEEKGCAIVAANTTTYFWLKNREDSITRINNHQYSLDQSICGMVDGLVYLDEWREKKGFSKGHLLPGYLGFLILLYKNYNMVLQNKQFSCLKEQTWFYAKKYYWSILKDIWSKITMEDLQEAYTRKMYSDYAHEEGRPVPSENGCIPLISFTDFIEQMDKEGFNPEELKDINKRLPQEIKDYNLKCGAVEQDYYN